MMAVLGKNPHFVDEDEEEDENTDDRVQSLLTKEHKQEAIVMNEAEENGSNYDDVDDDLEKKKNIFEEEENEEPSQESLDKKSYVYFHIGMMLAAAYMSMLFTNWGTNKDSLDTTGTVSFIVGTVSSWTAFVLFWWTLCAPKLCPSRFASKRLDD
eukprot:UN07737